MDLYDPLLERLFTLSAAEAATLDAPAPGLRARLSAALLLEGPVAEALRTRVWAARTLELASPPLPTAPFDPSAASALPALVATPWRVPEPWRRLAEERLAGRSLLILRGFFPDLRVPALAWTRFETDRVRGWRHTGTDPWPELVALLRSPGFRTLVGGVLGVPLGDAVTLNTWRMGPGDGMRAHPDGRRYSGTFAIGLNPDWTAADGGAIAFGTPTPAGFEVRERFVPFAGDLCLFVPTAESWHVVEPPRRERLTVSGWWGR
jgi:hypothetical protein